MDLATKSYCTDLSSIHHQSFECTIFAHGLTDREYYLQVGIISFIKDIVNICHLKQIFCISSSTYCYFTVICSRKN